MKFAFAVKVKVENHTLSPSLTCQTQTGGKTSLRQRVALRYQKKHRAGVVLKRLTLNEVQCLYRGHLLKVRTLRAIGYFLTVLKIKVEGKIC